MGTPELDMRPIFLLSCRTLGAIYRNHLGCSFERRSCYWSLSSTACPILWFFVAGLPPKRTSATCRLTCLYSGFYILILSFPAQAYAGAAVGSAAAIAQGQRLRHALHV